MEPPIRRDTPGNSDAAQDLYGLGVRLGIYLQVTGLMFSLARLRAGGTKITSAGLMLAILASWSNLARRKDISPAEAITILHLANALGLPAINACFVPETILGEGLGFFVTIVSMIWLNASNLFFWVAGYRALPLLGTRNDTWFFAKVAIDGWYRIFSLVFSAIACTQILVLLLPFKRIMQACAKDWLGRDSDSSIDDELRGIKSFIVRTASFALVLVIVLLVAAVEMTIKYNDLRPTTDFTQPGQSVPLTVGTITFLDGFLTLFSRTTRNSSAKPGGSNTTETREELELRN